MELVDYSQVLQESTNILEQALDKYNISEIFLSFNGGKDCTVLLDLMLKIIKRKCGTRDKIKVVYIQCEHAFSELEDFVQSVKKQYDLQLLTVPGNIKQALTQTLQEDQQLKACLMGTRRTDPYCEHLDFFQSTDAGWPQVMRVSPLLSWSYHQIWSYLLQNSVPYCQLYDQGYTSIGSVTNTVPNPSLKIQDPSASSSPGGVLACSYKPAYLLADGALERNGRGQNKMTNGNSH